MSDLEFIGNSLSQAHVMDNSCVLDRILEEMVQMKDEINQIRGKCSRLEDENKKLTIRMHHIDQINQQITNITNIQLIAFGEEKLDDIITDDCCKKILFRGFEAVPTLIKYVHFNKDIPEYHNCYISNARDNHAVIFNGIEWILVDVHDIINSLRTTSHDFLEKKFMSFSGTLSRQTNDKFGRYLQEKSSEEVLKRYKETIKLILYNDKDIVVETKNKTCRVKDVTSST